MPLLRYRGVSVEVNLETGCFAPATDLAAIYRTQAVRGSARVLSLEEALGFEGDVAPSEDDLRNERINFERLFSGECNGYADGLYREAMSRLWGKPIGEAENELRVLAYLQNLVAVALWKHGLAPSETLEGFARQFDRLDVESERRRLYEIAVKGYGPGA